MTYSVVALDPRTGGYGVAVQSHSFDVRRSVPWARSGIGAVATQATTDATYGQRGLDMMEAGVDPKTALGLLLRQDPDAPRRQVAMVGCDGEVAVHTGSACIRYASHIVGPTWSVQGNLLTNESVVPAMAEAFRSSSGPLVESLVSTLQSAEDAGGDLRGSQSAHLWVVPGPDSLAAGEEPVDLGTADHADPVGELSRLVEMDAADRALRRARRASDEGNEPEALRQLSVAARFRHGVEGDFWRGLVLARLERWEEARTVMEETLARRPVFAEVLARLAEHDARAAEVGRRLQGTSGLSPD